MWEKRNDSDPFGYKTQLKQNGVFASSAEKADALAKTDVSRDLQKSVEANGRYSFLGRVGALFGLSDSPSQLGVTVVMPANAPESIQKMWDPDTGSLRNGYHLEDLSREAKLAGIPIDIQANGITNSVSQATSNSVSMSLEEQAMGRNSIVLSAYNPTNGKILDGLECGLVKGGWNTATVEATRQLIEFAVDHNQAVAKDVGNPELGLTKVWGHSEGSLLVTQATLDGMEKDVRERIDMRVFGTATGAAPAGLNSFISVRNINDPVAVWAGQRLTGTGGVENSAGFIEGNLARPGSYVSVSTDFAVVDQNNVRIKGESNHSWQYYMVDPQTRAGLGLAPLNETLTKYYGRSSWQHNE